MRRIVTRRLLALLIDWLTICGYLAALAAIMLLFYLIVFDELPAFTATQTQLIATFTTVVPVVTWFTVKESRIPYSSLGKLQQELTVKYNAKPLRSAFIRNSLKFLPWQLAHMSVIDGIYNGWESPVTIIVYVLSIFLALTYVLQVVITPSHRHLPDLVAGARIDSLPN